MQPPDTEPSNCPPGPIAIWLPTGTGDEPQVETTVASGGRRSRRPKSWVYFCSTQAPLIETVILWEAAFTAYNSTAPLERLRLPP